MIIVSIDDHLIEPPNMFDAHVPDRYRNLAPRLVRNGDGKDEWIFEDQVMGMVGLNAVVTWPKEQWGMNPSALAEMRPGAYDIDERVRDMNRNGVLASMCFPSMAGFSGRTFQEANDKDLSLVMLKAYNDWHIDEWCGAYPGRFMPLSILPLWDMDAVVEELKRVAAKGACAVTMPELPHLAGLSHLPVGLVGPLLYCDVRSRRGHVSAHRPGPQCDQHAGHRRSTNSWSSPPRFRFSPFRTSFGGRPSASTPASRWRSRRAGSDGSRSCLTASTGITRTKPGPDRTSVRRSRQRFSESTPSHVSSPTPPP